MFYLFITATLTFCAPMQTSPPPTVTILQLASFLSVLCVCNQWLSVWQTQNFFTVFCSAFCLDRSSPAASPATGQKFLLKVFFQDVDSYLLHSFKRSKCFLIIRLQGPFPRSSSETPQFLQYPYEILHKGSSATFVPTTWLSPSYQFNLLTLRKHSNLYVNRKSSSE